MTEPTTPGVAVRAPAKINLHLGVGPVRADGFHPLATAYQAISLFSTVTATREQVFKVVDAAFAHRRKTLRSTLKEMAGSAAAAEAALAHAGVDPMARGEVLGVEDFARIAEGLALGAPAGEPRDDA